MRLTRFILPSTLTNSNALYLLSVFNSTSIASYQYLRNLLCPNCRILLVGDRVESQGVEFESNGERKWAPGTIRHLNHVESDGNRYPYQCLLDYPVDGDWKKH